MQESDNAKSKHDSRNIFTNGPWDTFYLSLLCVSTKVESQLQILLYLIQGKFLQHKQDINSHKYVAKLKRSAQLK